MTTGSQLVSQSVGYTGQTDILSGDSTGLIGDIHGCCAPQLICIISPAQPRFDRAVLCGIFKVNLFGKQTLTAPPEYANIWCIEITHK